MVCGRSMLKEKVVGHENLYRFDGAGIVNVSRQDYMAAKQRLKNSERLTRLENEVHEMHSALKAILEKLNG